MGKLGLLDLLVLTNLDQVIFNMNYNLFHKTSYPNEEVNRTETSTSVCVPWLDIALHIQGTLIQLKIILTWYGIDLSFQENQVASF
jgi:hypothetical protein